MKQFLYQATHFYFRWLRKKAMKDLGGKQKSRKMGSFQLSYWEFSRGFQKKVIFLHGLLDESFGFRKVLKHLLNEEFDFILIDLPGHGDSGLPDYPFLYQIDIWARLILETIEEMQWHTHSIVGHSMGGLVAQHVALLDAKQFVQSLVLIAPASAPHEKRDEMREILFPKNRTEVDRLFHFLYAQELPQINGFLKDYLVYIWNSKTNRYLETNSLKREKEIFLGKKASMVKIPTLIVAGEKDQITSLKDLLKLQKLIKKSTIVTVSESSHALPMEKSEEVAIHLKNFLFSGEIAENLTMDAKKKDTSRRR